MGVGRSVSAISRAAMLGCMAGLLALTLILPPDRAARAQEAAAQDANAQGQGISLSQSEETLFRADEVIHHSDLGVTVLRGDVEIAQAGYVLTADTVSYNREADTLTASGNVVLMHPDGTVMFSTYTEITSDGFKNGVIENIRILLTDRTRIAANGARRSNGNTTEMAKAVYSPCEVCRDDPSQAPLWQLKARQITHDEEDYKLRYRDVWLEVAGVPVLYSPYFEHYDPRVQRKSGLLIPRFGSNRGLGRFVQPRYFWAVSGDKDITFEPIIGTTGDGILAAQYRQRFDRGEMDFDFSFGRLDSLTRDGETDDDDAIAGEEELDDREYRGHLRANAIYHIDDTWRTGLNLNRVTDRSYGRAYPLFGIPDTQLVSKGYVEGFRRRNYANAEMLAIQSLRTEEPANFREQNVIPRLAYNGLGEADPLGGRWQFDTEARFLANEDDDDLHRFTVAPGYGLTRTSSLGFKTDFKATVDANGYVIERDYSRGAQGGKSFDFEGMVVPKASTQISYPFARFGEQTTQTLTPLVFGSLAPDVDPPNNIVFEDVTTYELDELTLLSHDPLNGEDALESGSRAAAALRYNLSWFNSFEFDAILARMLAETDPNELDERLNLQRNSNDWVGSVGIAHEDYGDVRYRVRTNTLGFETIRRQEVAWSVGPSFLRLTGNYTFVADESNGPTDGNTESLTVGFAGGFSAPAPCEGGNARWGYNASANRDLAADDTRRISGALSWGNECATVALNFNRTYTEVGGRGAQLDTLLLRFSLKTLGEYELDVDTGTGTQ